MAADLDSLFEKFESATQKDLKLNFKKFFSESALSEKEAGLIVLSCAESLAAKSLSTWVVGFLSTRHTTPDEIQEARDVAALMGLMNTYYRFRHFIENEFYQSAPGLRMTVMARPLTGKVIFEMMALAVSILNGCEACVKSHEKSLVDQGTEKTKIHDLARLASCTKAIAVTLSQV